MLCLQRIVVQQNGNLLVTLIESDTIRYFVEFSANSKTKEKKTKEMVRKLCDHWSQASWAQPVFRWIKLSEEWRVLLWSNLGVKLTWLFRETGGNSALEADPRISQIKKKGYESFLYYYNSEKPPIRWLTHNFQDGHIHLKNWLSTRCLSSVIGWELVFPSWHQPLTYWAAMLPLSLDCCTATLITSQMVCIHLKTGWAQDAWFQLSYENWYLHLDISRWHTEQPCCL